MAINLGISSASAVPFFFSADSLPSRPSHPPQKADQRRGRNPNHLCRVRNTPTRGIQHIQHHANSRRIIRRFTRDIQPLRIRKPRQINRLAQVNRDLNPQSIDRRLPIPMLRARFPRDHGNAARLMRQTDGGAGLIPFLPARPGPAKRLKSALGQQLLVGEMSETGHSGTHTLSAIRCQ